MKISLLIASGDDDYTEHLSGVLSERYKDAFYVSVCRSSQNLRELLAVSGFDAALLEPPLANGIDLSPVRLPVMLWDDSASGTGVQQEELVIRKYQRISSIAAYILEYYAKISADEFDPGAGRAYITAVWSPAGGVGKTTVAVAQALKQSSAGKNVVYLNMEHFSSSPAYFDDDGRSISSVFEMLEKNTGNLKMLIQAIIRKDADSGIHYFRGPENYDDVNILSEEDASALLTACAGVTEELVVDLPSSCDVRTRQVFRLADRVLLVTDQSSASAAKLRQFVSQHSVFEQFKSKLVLVANKGSAYSDHEFAEAISLPLAQSADPATVSKALSSRI